MTKDEEIKKLKEDIKAIGRECPAYKQDGECGSCRACWSRKVKQVSYKEH